VGRGKWSERIWSGTSGMVIVAGLNVVIAVSCWLHRQLGLKSAATARGTMFDPSRHR